MRIRYGAILLIIVIILTIVSCGPPPTPAPTPTPTVHPGKELVTSRCATCHAIGVVESAKKDLGGWQATVERMVTAGAQLDDAQQEVVIDYLALTFPKE